ncbi:MAG: hypothetical protein V3R93_01950, partial [Candidatus Hydrothermarchaeaceae archaeon]
DWNVTHALITIDMLAREHNMYHILDTYGRPRYVVYGYTGETTLEGNYAENYADITVVYTRDGKKAVRGGGTYKDVYYREKGALVHKEYTGANSLNSAIYVSNGEFRYPFIGQSKFVVHIPPNLENSMLTSLALFNGENLEHFTLVYNNRQIMIYEVNY